MINPFLGSYASIYIIYIYNDALCIILRQKLSVVMSLLRVKSHFTCGDPLIHLIIVIVTSLFCSWLTNRKGRVNPERAMEADNQKVENPQGEIPPQVARLLPAVPPAAPGAVSTGQPPGLVPPTLPAVPQGQAGPTAGPGPAVVPSPMQEKGQFGLRGRRPSSHLLHELF